MISAVPISKDLVRCDGWPAALSAEFAAWQNRGFSWGEWDCISFCRAMGARLCGVDPLGDLPGYASERQALRELRRLGYASAVDLVSAHLVEVAPGMARRGDWVLIPTDSLLGCAFGVNMGRQSAHMDIDGLVMVDAAATARAWKVGQ